MLLLLFLLYGFLFSLYLGGLINGSGWYIFVVFGVEVKYWSVLSIFSLFSFSS